MDFARSPFFDLLTTKWPIWVAWRGKKRAGPQVTSQILVNCAMAAATAAATCGPLVCGLPLSKLLEEMLSKLACVWIPVSSGPFQID